MHVYSVPYPNILVSLSKGRIILGIMIYTKSKPDYVDPDADFKPLPKYGHLSRKHPAYEAAEEAIRTSYSELYGLPDIESFRSAAGDADASIPPGGPDRYRDVVTELMYFKTRDGHKRELKIYKSPKTEPNAVLMYRMHGGGKSTAALGLGYVETKYTDDSSHSMVCRAPRG